MASDWFRGSVIYHIFIDRFNGFQTASGQLPDDMKPEFCGGTLRGITEKIPYLHELGVDGILLTPFYTGVAYHGYHVTDFFSVDARFGTDADLRELIRAAHGHGLRVIADFVPNHCSREHPFFKAALADPKSRYNDWFFINHKTKRYRRFFEVDELPKFNLNNPEAAAHLIDAVLHWASFGIAGFRIDHAIGPSRAFLRALRKTMAEKYPDALIFGEAWFPRLPFRFLKLLSVPHKYLRFLTHRLSQDGVQRDMEGLMDGTLDFAAREIFLRHFIHCHESAEHNEALFFRMARHYRNYPAHFFLPAFLDNHDTNRVLFECGNDKKKLMRVLALLFSLLQPVLLYYGTESGLSQKRPLNFSVPYSDLETRRLMNWDSFDNELFEYVKRLIRLRKEAKTRLVDTKQERNTSR